MNDVLSERRALDVVGQEIEYWHLTSNVSSTDQEASIATSHPSPYSHQFADREQRLVLRLCHPTVNGISTSPRGPHRSPAGVIFYDEKSHRYFPNPHQQFPRSVPRMQAHTRGDVTTSSNSRQLDVVAHPSARRDRANLSTGSGVVQPAPLNWIAVASKNEASRGNGHSPKALLRSGEGIAAVTNYLKSGSNQLSEGPSAAVERDDGRLGFNASPTSDWRSAYTTRSRRSERRRFSGQFGSSVRSGVDRQEKLEMDDEDNQRPDNTAEIQAHESNSVGDTNEQAEAGNEPVAMDELTLRARELGLRRHAKDLRTVEENVRKATEELLRQKAEMRQREQELVRNEDILRWNVLKLAQQHAELKHYCDELRGHGLQLYEQIREHEVRMQIIQRQREHDIQQEQGEAEGMLLCSP